LAQKKSKGGFVSQIAVIGAGAWGTALAIALGRKNTHNVRLWAYEKEVVESVRERQTNDVFLAGCLIPHTVSVTNDLGEAIEGADFILSVMPSHHARRVYQQMKPHLNSGMIFVSATKGIENDTFLRMSEVIQQVVHATPGGFTPRLAALSKGSCQGRPYRDHSRLRRPGSCTDCAA
jgi:glycerol-3-phosphate dehydrogenase (NAD(P)+)